MAGSQRARSGVAVAKYKGSVARCSPVHHTSAKATATVRAIGERGARRSSGTANGGVVRLYSAAWMVGTPGV